MPPAEKKDTNEQLPRSPSTLSTSSILNSLAKPSPIDTTATTLSSLSSPSSPNLVTPTSPISPINSSTTETVIIFDWDDTLLASSFLSGKGYRLDSILDKQSETELQLRELEQSVITVINLALSYGHVHIITNAETGWVQLSAQKFIPGVVPLLSKVKVLSARSTYESFYPESPLKWKFYAIQDKIAKCIPEHKEKNVLSFGDSHVEREAVRAATRGMSNTRTKSVKFAERPSMEQLRRQIELVTNCFQYIYHHDGDLDLQLTVTINADGTTNHGANGSSTSSPFTPLSNTPIPPNLSSLNHPVSTSSSSSSTSHHISIPLFK